MDSAAPVCTSTDCRCAVDGKHSGKRFVHSPQLGGEFCCRRCYARTHYMLNREATDAYTAEWKKRNPDLVRGQAQRSYRRNERQKRDYMLYTKYGITLAQYEEMVMSQCGACGICGESEARHVRGKLGRLMVHHDHFTGLVIALLCHRCNVGLGMFNDDSRLVYRAAAIQEGK